MVGVLSSSSRALVTGWDPFEWWNGLQFWDPLKICCSSLPFSPCQISRFPAGRNVEHVYQLKGCGVEGSEIWVQRREILLTGEVVIAGLELEVHEVGL